MASVKLIVGLGNPGPEYQFSPHNMGFMVVDRLAERHSVRLTRKQYQSLCGRALFGKEPGEKEVWLIQPQTFMNLSGGAVKEWLVKQNCGPEELLVIADELDLPWGSMRIRQKGGAAGHHGLESIIETIGSKEFTRLRIGVSPEHPLADTVEYLLSPLKKSRRREMEEIIDRASEAVETILQEGAAKAMSLYNQRSGAAGPVSKTAASDN
jgi:PTH1 family peptidyl-tRNA hydrolase